jgi:hypothetical protein
VPPERRTWRHEERYGPSFIGSRDSQREVLFAEAIRLGADVQLRGPGWIGANATPANTGSGSLLARLRNQREVARQFGLAGLLWKLSYRGRRRVTDDAFAGHVLPAVFGDGYFDVTQQSTLTLGVNRYPSFHSAFSRPDTYSRLRDVEAPMLGACYLTEWTEGLDQMYDLGTEIDTYRSPAEMVERLRVLSGDETRRSAMRRAGQRRALAEHSVPRTIERIGAELGVARIRSRAVEAPQ